MKKNLGVIILRIIGIGIILTGIVMTIIPMFNFDVFTFNLGRSIVFAFGFTFVGIVLIIGSVIYSSYKRMNNNILNTTEEIAQAVKENIAKEKESKKPKKCQYCGAMIDADKSNCNNCGASTKHK